ncbi:MAG: hypothetical protein NT082_06585 [Chloroflexi bacterium]|nr:hypothetical protein [Chloroflexota bacterium]
MKDTAKTMQVGRRQKLEVVIYTQTLKIVGTVHTMPDSRLVDFMNSRFLNFKEADLFIVVTDATVYILPQENLLQSAEFLTINKRAIMLVLPKPPDTPIISAEQSKDTAVT